MEQNTVLCVDLIYLYHTDHKIWNKKVKVTSILSREAMEALNVTEFHVVCFQWWNGCHREDLSISNGSNGNKAAQSMAEVFLCLTLRSKMSRNSCFMTSPFSVTGRLLPWNFISRHPPCLHKNPVEEYTYIRTKLLLPLRLMWPLSEIWGWLPITMHCDQAWELSPPLRQPELPRLDGREEANLL